MDAELAIVVPVLSCLSDIPQPRADLAADCGLQPWQIGEAIKVAKRKGWCVEGSHVAGYTLHMSIAQRAWLFEQLCAATDDVHGRRDVTRGVRQDEDDVG